MNRIPGIKRLRGKTGKIYFGITGLMLATLLLPAGCAEPVPPDLLQPTATVDTHNTQLTSTPAKIITPVIKLETKLGAMSSEGLPMAIKASVDNSNSVVIDVQELHLNVNGKGGRNYLQNSLPGCQIAALSEAVFNQSVLLPSAALSEDWITVTADTRMEAGQQVRNLNASSMVGIRLKELVKEPELDLVVQLGKLDSHGINTVIEVKMKNPNPVRLDLGQMEIIASSASNTNILQVNIDGSSIDAGSSDSFTREIILPSQVLAERNLVFTIRLMAGVTGINYRVIKSVSVPVPGLGEFIVVPKMTMDAQCKWIDTYPIPNVDIQFDVEIENVNNLNLSLGDVTLGAYRTDGTLIKSKSLTGVVMGSQYPWKWQDILNLNKEITGQLGKEVDVKFSAVVGLNHINNNIPISIKKTIILRPPSW